MKAVQIHSKAGRAHFHVMVEDSTANSIAKVALPTVTSAVYGQDCVLIIDWVTISCHFWSAQPLRFPYLVPKLCVWLCPLLFLDQSHLRGISGWRLYSHWWGGDSGNTEVKRLKRNARLGLSCLNIMGATEGILNHLVVTSQARQRHLKLTYFYLIWCAIVIVVSMCSILSSQRLHVASDDCMGECAGQLSRWPALSLANPCEH